MSKKIPAPGGAYHGNSYLCKQEMVEVHESGLRQWGFLPSAVRPRRSA
jgi:hypothetical protein